MSARNWQWLHEFGDRLSGQFVTQLEALDEQVQQGGGGSQPIRLLGPYTMSVADVIAAWDVNHATVEIGYTPAVGDVILDVLLIVTTGFDNFTGIDSANPSLNVGDSPLVASAVLLAETAGGDLLNDFNGPLGTISLRNYDLTQSVGPPTPALVVSAEPVTARIIGDGDDPPTVGSVDFYFLVATPTAP